MVEIIIIPKAKNYIFGTAFEVWVDLVKVDQLQSQPGF